MRIPSMHALLPRPRSVLLFLGGLSVAFAIGMAGLSGHGPVAALNRFALDTLQVQFASGARAPDTVVVDIDDASLAALGQWPWPRYRIAQLIDRVAACKPSAIAMDILFSEPDRTSLADIRRTFKHDFGIDVSIGGVPSALLDNDGFLGREMARANVVGARYFHFDRVTRDPHPLRPGVGFEGRLDLLSLQQAPGALDNIDAVASQIRISGFVNSGLDEDGVLRRLPLLIEHDGVIHPSLALAATMRALRVPSGRVESDIDGLSIRVGSHRIPVNRAGYAVLRFNGRSQRYESIPAVDVLANRARAADFRGKIVFIGSSATGLHDVHRTAVDPAFSGLKIQAVMAQDILDNDAVRIPSWGGEAALLAGLLIAAVFSGVFIAGRGLMTLAAFAAASGAALLAVAAVMFARASVFVPIGAPVLVLITLLVVSFVAHFVANQRRAQQWRRQLENARQVAMESMAAVAETRDPETGAHIQRTQHYVRAVARQLQRMGQYTDILNRQYIRVLFLSAPLHDIGKVGVPDHILLKPGPLTDDELKIMRRHAEFGRQIIHSASEHIQGDNFLVVAGEIAATHHEKWDGTGYPDGLRGRQIPLAGRIMAVADIYDALISRRCYKEPFPHQQSMSIIRELRGTTFDPVVLDAFLAIESEILQIAKRFRDGDEASAPEASEEKPQEEPGAGIGWWRGRAAWRRLARWAVPRAAGTGAASREL